MENNVDKGSISLVQLKSSGDHAQPIAVAFWQRFKQLLLTDYFILIISIVGYIIAAQSFDRLGRPTNIANQLLNMWPLFAVAIGQTFVLIIAGIDLSQGSIMAIASVVGAIIMAQGLDPSFFDKTPIWGSLITEEGGLLAGHELAALMAVVGMIVVGGLIGFLNGTLITRFNITPFMATLITLIFFSYFALWLTQSRNIPGLPEDFIRLGDGEIVSVYFGEKIESDIKRRDIPPLITYSAVISVGLALIGGFILKRTTFGKQMFAIGTNPRASIVSGIQTKKVITLVYVFSGMCAAVASIIFTARLEIGRPTLGDGNILLDIIGACVIGGTSLFGGKGSIRGTFYGVVFFTLLINILNAAQLSPFVIDAVKGGVILLAALLDITRTRLLEAERVS